MDNIANLSLKEGASYEETTRTLENRVHWDAKLVNNGAAMRIFLAPCMRETLAEKVFAHQQL